MLISLYFQCSIANHVKFHKHILAFCFGPGPELDGKYSRIWALVIAGDFELKKISKKQRVDDISGGDWGEDQLK